ncbi:TRAP transporter small permease subunit [Marinomonas sp. THO17]|uniref:TRAP transporter small permease subunit n=1 Tax=Marinomonas sp. THO17 TaxID=3149048 RepID=UPI00336BF884
MNAQDTPDDQLFVDSSIDSNEKQLPETQVSKFIDQIIYYVGQTISWIWVLLLLVIVLNVFMRYALGEGRIEFEELQWHLYATGWMIGLSYCFVRDKHVRVDILRDCMSLKTQAWIELLGILFLLLPFIGVVIWYSIPFIHYSWELNEVSAAPGGLPYRWVIKSVLLFGFILLSLAVLSRLSRICSLLFMKSAKPLSKPSQMANV